MPRRRVATLLLALQAGAAGPVAERLRVVITLLLLAELHASGALNARRRPWMRTGPVAAGPRGPRPAPGSQSGRRPRGSPAGGWDPRETATSMHNHPLHVLQHDRWI